MKKKYKLLKKDTIEVIPVDGNKIFRKLYRIRALQDFGDVRKGDLGGYVESEDNLSQFNTCWIDEKSKIYGNAYVSLDAKVIHSTIFDTALVSGNAIVEDSTIYGNAKISSYSKIKKSSIYGNADIFENAEVINSFVFGSTVIRGDAYITSTRDWASVVSFGSRDDSTTFFRCKDGKIRVACGCFFGTIKEFKKRVKEEHSDNKFGKEYLKLIELMKLRFSKPDERKDDKL